MNNLTRLLLLSALCIVVIIGPSTKLALADPLADDATCAITCTVNGIMEWDTATFTTGIALGPVTGRAVYTDSGTDMIILYTNGSVDITADSGDNDALLVTGTSDTLTTKYGITFDYTSAGTNTYGVAGADGGEWQLHNEFLTPVAAAVTHYNGDGDIQVTLSCQVSTTVDEVPDKGAYTATQTLTATWTGPAD